MIKNLIIALIIINIYFSSITCAQTVSDGEGNIYNTTTIGNQVWLAENLRSTKFSNGNTINLIQDSIQWSSQSSAAYCFYNNNASYINPYGNLYNWYTVNDSRNICPSGYHVPNTSEWDELVNYLGGSALAGGKLKQIGFSYWLSPNTDADNTSGFSALGSGWRANNNGTYENLQFMCYLWSTTAQSLNDADIVLIGYDSPACYSSSTNKLTGLPVRCLQNSGTTNLKDLKKIEIELHPNPVTDKLVLKTSNQMIGANYSIYDYTGKIIYSGIITSQNTIINTSDLNSGIYLINFENNFINTFIKLNN